MKPRQSPKQIEIEQEYGEPFWDVVKSYADSGESMTATAVILGYSSTAFRRLVTRHDHRDWFPAPVKYNGYISEKESRKGLFSSTLESALEKARKNNPCHAKLLIDGIEDTIKGHALRKGIPTRTVYNRLRRGMTIDGALYQGYMYKTPKNKNHHWRKQ